MRIRLNAIVILLWLGFIVPGTAGGQTVSVSGIVTDPQGGVVAAASVTLTAPNSARPLMTRTDGSGAFSLVVPPGRYTLQIDSPGFVTWMQDVNAVPGLAPIKATLQIAGVLEDVQVSGSAPYTLTKPIPTASRLGLPPLETPASVAVVSGDLIRDLGTTTLIEAKSLAPGITASAPMGNGGNVLTARGFTGANSVKQLYNGMEIYNGGNVVAFPFDPWNVDFVGVLSGPASVLYGLTTDGLKVYLEAVESAFNNDIDYATLQKVYGADPQAEKRYSPAKIVSSTTEVIIGLPNPKHISTSYVERQNLTMRMSMRRFTRLTNAFSKKLENHVASVALYFMHYNFARVHKTLRVTPAMAAGVSDHVWSLDEVVELLEATERQAA